MKRFLILAALFAAALTLTVTATAGPHDGADSRGRALSNYVQGAVQYGANHAGANGYTVKLYQKVYCGLGCSFWANTQNTTSAYQQGVPGFYSFNVSGANSPADIRVTSCGGGYGTGGWVQPGPFTNGISFARLSIWYGIGC